MSLAPFSLGLHIDPPRTYFKAWSGFFSSLFLALDVLEFGFLAIQLMLHLKAFFKRNFMLRSQLRNGEDVFDLIADIVVARHAPWRSQAACRDFPKSVFFNTNGQPADEEAAKKVCGSCSVQRECRDDWLEMSSAMQGHGVWWGTLPRERRDLRSQRS